MNATTDDQFDERLALLDERVASGLTIAAETAVEEPHLAARLNDALRCLQLLEKVWPRQRNTTPAAMPRTFGRYHVVRELARGGFGIVFLAEDMQLTRDVALKVQRPDVVLSPDARKRFLREARFAAPLNHPNLVTVFDSGEESFWCWIAAEVVYGPALCDYLASLEAKAELPGIRDAVQLIHDLAEGVAHAHAHGVLHRDIKPANILLEPRCEAPQSLADYRAKLADFGLARSLETPTGETRTGTRLGTPAYMAVEQVEGDTAQVGPSTDVYALGVVLYELLAGRPPFTGERDSDVLKQVLLKEPPSLRASRPEVSRDLEAVILKSLQKEPAQRYATAQALADDLNRVLKGEPTTARPVRAMQRAMRTVRNYKVASLAILTSALLGGMLLGIRRRPNQKPLPPQVRVVMLDTDPPRARVAFVPLDALTGEPIESGIVYPNHRSPITQELAPGEYLVVAAADDGRFHEVFRHVPSADAELPELPAQRTFRELGNNRVRLPQIKLFDQSVVQGMALVEDDVVKVHPYARPAYRAFYMDPAEMSYGKASSVLNWITLKAASGIFEDDAYAAVTSYDHAMALAESLGKRLPFSFEYEIAAAHCQFHCQASPHATATSVPGFGPVGFPVDDLTDTQPPIVGLRSNVAEWTASRDRPQPGHQLPNWTFLHSQLVHGGSPDVLKGINLSHTEIRDHDTPIMALRFRTWPGVGLRCVRSASPSFLPPLKKLPPEPAK